jgi:hypothetical protein
MTCPLRATRTPRPTTASAHIFLTDWHSAGAFVSWCESQSRALVVAESRRVEKLGLALLENGTLSGSECAAILAEP